MVRPIIARRAEQRSAFTLAELLVSVATLLTIMTLTTTLCFRVQQVWKDIRHQRVAEAELANQLEWLTPLNREQLDTAIKQLTASETCSRTLRHPNLTATVSEDELGTRVTLSLTWQRRVPGKAVRLSGWLSPDPSRDQKDEQAGPRTAPNASGPEVDQ